MKVKISKYPKDPSKERKIEVRIDDHDLWGFYNTLSHIIHPALVRMKEVKHGAPFTDDEDVPEELKSTSAPPKENEWDTDENHFKRWDYVLDEMIFAFGSEVTGWEDQFHSGESDIKFEPIEGSDHFEMVRGPKDTWVFDMEGHQAYQARMKNGFRLFGKYYQSLWD